MMNDPSSAPPALSRGFSVYLDLVRFSAAMIVLLSHASKSGIADQILPNLVQQGIDAVTVFFVLSGFVISHTAANKDRDLHDYVLARLARLWSVGLPALLLAALLAHVGMAQDPDLYNRQVIHDRLGSPLLAEFLSDYPLLRFLAGMLFLNEAWTVTIVQFQNAPYWSLSYEFCYYMLFGFAFYLTGGLRVLFLVLTVAVFGPKILLLLPTWLLGVALHRYRPRLAPALAWAFACLPFPAYFAGSLAAGAERSWWFDQFLPFDPGWSQHFVWQYFLAVLVGTHLLGMRSLLQGRNLAHVVRPIRWLAARTLSIYLFHFPVLYCLTAVLPRNLPGRGAAILGLTLVCVFALGQVTELRKGAWRQMLEWLTAGLRQKSVRPG